MFPRLALYLVLAVFCLVLKVRAAPTRSHIISLASRSDPKSSAKLPDAANLDLHLNNVDGTTIRAMMVQLMEENFACDVLKGKEDYINAGSLHGEMMSSRRVQSRDGVKDEGFVLSVRGTKLYCIEADAL